MFRNIILLIITGLIFFSCDTKKETKLFEYVDSSKSKITFSNTIIENDSINSIDCQYCYNGGGVGIGDFNNDGLSDIVFTGNQVSSKIYLNLNSLKFKDISKESNFLTNTWVTGVSIVDINSDGWDDIYLNVGGQNCNGNCNNLLYINNGLNSNGIPTFSEKAKSYGLDDGYYSQQSIFFDYDRDGDLDVYILHNGDLNSSKNKPIPKRYFPDYLTDFLLRNDSIEGINHPIFTNVSEEMGITHKGFGLGVGISDFNNDNLPDIYVANDFITDDALYLNREFNDSLKPRFEEVSNQYLAHETYNAMGMDIADINNDNLPDILVLDMFPKNYQRQKRILGVTNYEKYLLSINNNYSSQYMRNTLQINNGTLNGNPIKSSEVGFLKGITSTGWSWSPLMIDLDNDGDKDIYITNGYIKDIIDLDFVNYSMQNNIFGSSEVRKNKLKKLLEDVPPIKISNFIYEHKNNNSFEDVSSTWAIDKPSLSNGAAYADLDLDGDLDIVVNNINGEAFLLENKTSDRLENNHYLRIKLIGNKKNPDAIGTKVTIWSENEQQYQFQSVIRGYLSSVEPILHFGVKNDKIIDSMRVIWPDGRISKLKNIQTDQLLQIQQYSAINASESESDKKKIFNSKGGILNFKHKENKYNDYANQHLLMRQYSQLGPCIANANIDGKKGDEIFIGGSLNEPGRLWFQDDTGAFKPKQELDSIYEDSDAVFFDVDGDKDLDLYVSSGGNEFIENSSNYKDRLYLNNGEGIFSKAENNLPNIFQSTSCIKPLDIDHDGDMDIFVGSRISPGNYPKIPESNILINNNGHFTKQTLPFISDVGMVTDAIWKDIDNDNWEDLIIVGEYMSITIFKNNKGKLMNMPTVWFDESNKEITTEGWWNSIEAADFDSDGDIDFIVGNQGLNGYVKPQKNEPIYIYKRDFDKNGSLDPVVGQNFEVGGERKLFPIQSRDDVMSQLPILKNKYLTYEEFSKVDFKTLLLIKDLESETLKATTFKSSYIENLGNGKFRIIELPDECQVAPINDILVGDFNNDTKLDALLVGNDFSAEANYGRFDALTGILLKGNGNSSFSVIPSNESGFYVPNQSHHITSMVNSDGEMLVVVTQNKGELLFFQVE